MTRKKTLRKRMRLFWADAERREIEVSDEIDDADDMDVHPSALEAAMDYETGRLAMTHDIFNHSSAGWGRDHHFDYISERTPVLAFLVSRVAASSSPRSEIERGLLHMRHVFQTTWGCTTASSEWCMQPRQILVGSSDVCREVVSILPSKAGTTP